MEFTVPCGTLLSNYLDKRRGQACGSGSYAFLAAAAVVANHGCHYIEKAASNSRLLVFLF
jgi:hypothetical protein